MRAHGFKCARFSRCLKIAQTDCGVLARCDLFSMQAPLSPGGHLFASIAKPYFQPFSLITLLLSLMPMRPYKIHKKQLLFIFSVHFMTTTSQRATRSWSARLCYNGEAAMQCTCRVRLRPVAVYCLLHTLVALGQCVPCHPNGRTRAETRPLAIL